MKVKLVEGMRFQSIDGKHGEFTIRKFDYYGDNDPIWCGEDEKFIFPLSEIALESYMPLVDGKWINEPNTYED